MAMLWERVSLDEIIDRFEAGVSVRSKDRPASNGEHGVLKVSCVSISGFRPAENKVVLPEELPRLGPTPRRGDVILTRANTVQLVALAVTVNRDYPTLHLSDKHWRVILRDAGRDNLTWVKHVINSPIVRRALVSRATGTSGSMKNVSQEEFLKIGVPRPPIEVQNTIAETLDTFEVARTQLEYLLDAKRRLKRGLVQELLTMKRRFRDYADRLWELVSLRDVLTESRIPSSDSRHTRRLTIRLYGKGVIPSEGKRAGSETTRYYRRRAGQFVYSKLDFLNGACGVVPPKLDGFETTLDLPAFDASPVLDVHWLTALVSQPWFYRRHVGLAIGGRKAKRMNPRAFLGIQVAMPGHEEQVCIAEFLESLEQEIGILHRLRAALDRQRQGVADLLLTGKVRLPA